MGTHNISHKYHISVSILNDDPFCPLTNQETAFDHVIGNQPMRIQIHRVIKGTCQHQHRRNENEELSQQEM